jgi:hypothetical protein
MLLSCAALVVSLACVSAAQDRPPRARIVVSVFSTDRSGASRKENSMGEYVSFRSGETLKSVFHVSKDGMSLVVGGPPGQTVSKHQYSWQVTARLISVSLDSVAFDLDWQRSEGDDGNTLVTAGDRRTITLRQGDRHVLDLVNCSPANSRLANVFLELQAMPVEDPAFAALTLEYDLWLVQQAAGGTKTTRHFTVKGRQGEKVPFVFEPVALPLEVQTQGGTESPLKMFIEGTISGRGTADGIIQVSLQPKQYFRFNDDPRWGGGSGSKTFSISEGETVDLELPSLPATASGRVEPGKITAPAPGVSLIESDLVRVDFDHYFAGARTSILITVRR